MEWGRGPAPTPPPLRIVRGGHGSRPWCPPLRPERLTPGQARPLRGPAGGLVAADLGVPDGTPDVKDKFVREGEVAKPLVQRLSQLIRVLFVLSEFHHGGRWTGTGSRMEAQIAAPQDLDVPSPELLPTPRPR